jgi:hypothetical protein
LVWGSGLRRQPLIGSVTDVLAGSPVWGLVLSGVRLVDMLLDQVGRDEDETLRAHLDYDVAAGL